MPSFIMKMILTVKSFWTRNNLKEAHLVIQTELSKSDKEIILATSSSSDGVCGSH